MKFYPRNGKQACIVIGIVFFITLSVLVTGYTTAAELDSAPALDLPALSPDTVSPAIPDNYGGELTAFAGKDNGATKNIILELPFAIKLRTNPSTGFSWNVSTTGGLKILFDYYVGDPHPMHGAGGTQTWVLLSTECGESSFTAVSIPPGNPIITGNETTYTLNFTTTHPIIC